MITWEFFQLINFSRRIFVPKTHFTVLGYLLISFYSICSKSSLFIHSDTVTPINFLKAALKVL